MTVIAFPRNQCHECRAPIAIKAVFCAACIARDERRRHPARSASTGGVGRSLPALDAKAGGDGSEEHPSPPAPIEEGS